MLKIKDVLTLRESLIKHGAKEYELKCQHLWSHKLPVELVVCGVKLCLGCASQIDEVDFYKSNEYRNKYVRV